MITESPDPVKVTRRWSSNALAIRRFHHQACSPPGVPLWNVSAFYSSRQRVVFICVAFLLHYNPKEQNVKLKLFVMQTVDSPISLVV